MPTPLLSSAANSLEEKLKEKVHSLMLDVLPEETIDAYVKQAVSDFVMGTERKDTYGRDEGSPSKLKTMVNDIVGKALAEQVTVALRARLDEAIPQNIAKEDLDATVNKAISMLGPQLLGGVLNAMMVPMLNGLSNDILSRVRNGAMSGALTNWGLPL